MSTPRFNCVDDYLDSELEQAYNLPETRLPETANYNALLRLWQHEEMTEGDRGFKEMQRELEEHKSECEQSHYYGSDKGNKYCCPQCMPLINRLYGLRNYYHVQKKVA